MYHMILLVLDDINHCSSILEAWEAQGVGGVTILESTGLGRARKLSIRDDIPLMPSLVTDDLVDKVIAATEAIIGDLESPDNGVIFVLPVSRVKGLHEAQKRASAG